MQGFAELLQDFAQGFDRFFMILGGLAERLHAFGLCSQRVGEVVQGFAEPLQDFAQCFHRFSKFWEGSQSACMHCSATAVPLHSNCSASVATAVQLRCAGVQLFRISVTKLLCRSWQRFARIGKEMQLQCNWGATAFHVQCSCGAIVRISVTKSLCKSLQRCCNCCCKGIARI